MTWWNGSLPLWPFSPKPITQAYWWDKHQRNYDRAVCIQNTRAVLLRTVKVTKTRKVRRSGTAKRNLERQDSSVQCGALGGVLEQRRGTRESKEIWMSCDLYLTVTHQYWIIHCNKWIMQDVDNRESWQDRRELTVLLSSQLLYKSRNSKTYSLKKQVSTYWQQERRMCSLFLFCFVLFQESVT